MLAALSLLAIVTHKDFQYTLKLVGYELFPKGYQFVVTSTLDETLQKLKDEMEKKDAKIKEMEVKYNMMQEELRKLQCLVTSVSVPLTKI